MRLKISHITDFVNCLNGGLLVFCASSLTHTLLQPFNDDKYIFTLYDDGKSKPTEKKCQPFLFRLPLNPFTHWLRFQFSIEIYPSIQINHLFLLRASSESLSPISIAFTLYLFTSLLIYLALFRLSLAFWKLYTWNWGPNHFVRKSIKSKMVWLMADMRILLILWKCGKYFAFDVLKRYIK